MPPYTYKGPINRNTTNKVPKTQLDSNYLWLIDESLSAIIKKMTSFAFWIVAVRWFPLDREVKQKPADQQVFSLSVGRVLTCQKELDVAFPYTTSNARSNLGIIGEKWVPSTNSNTIEALVFSFRILSAATFFSSTVAILFSLASLQEFY